MTSAKNWTRPGNGQCSDRKGVEMIVDVSQRSLDSNTNVPLSSVGGPSLYGPSTVSGEVDGALLCSIDAAGDIAEWHSRNCIVIQPAHC